MKKNFVLCVNGTRKNTEPPGDVTELGDSKHIGGFAMKTWATSDEEFDET